MIDENLYIRKTENELKYFGSDFNKYLHSLSKEMSVINIDTVQYKRSKKSLRLIEYKHLNEPDMDHEQHEIYHILDVFLHSKIENNLITKCSIGNWKINVYTVRGDSPFKTIIVKNLTTNQMKTFIGEDVKKWCEFEIDF